jgi:superfamily II DNA/RNA helicase
LWYRSEPSSEKIEEADEKKAIRDKMQTFIFSATMSKDLQRNLKRFKTSKPKSAEGTTIGERETNHRSRVVF